MRSARYLPACLAIAALLLVACSSGSDKSTGKLGEIDFTVTGKAEAQPAFKKPCCSSIVLNMKMRQKHSLKQENLILVLS